ncbi:hypothetical protein G7072_10960 [Nocardioides sp. HDW12B]|uniref:hypothetical protein n=1 Tax=Nocardioides sp. HDW12B TaxID=2714939 RepID=UPI00140CA922|nr:hypothetical protein [Nocardioides sp. HDW12B]QIK66789.1 hypothetical protein G7072_10960 [Nocardioides sp. HDW12B]
MTPSPTDLAPGRDARGSARRERLLRAEVAALRRREQRRIFPARLCLGPGPEQGPGHALAWPPRDPPDVGLVFDLVDSLLDAGGEPGEAGTGSGGDSRLWLVRPGHPEVHDLDLRVASVALRVAAARGPAYGAVCGPMVVLTRYGWLDPLTGESRRWKRLRLQDR